MNSGPGLWGASCGSRRARGQHGDTVGPRRGLRRSPPSAGAEAGNCQAARSPCPCLLTFRGDAGAYSFHSSDTAPSTRARCWEEMIGMDAAPVRPAETPSEPDGQRPALPPASVRADPEGSVGREGHRPTRAEQEDGARSRGDPSRSPPEPGLPHARCCFVPNSSGDTGFSHREQVYQLPQELRGTKPHLMVPLHDRRFEIRPREDSNLCPKGFPRPSTFNISFQTAGGEHGAF